MSQIGKQKKMRYQRVLFLTGFLLLWHGPVSAESTSIMDFLGEEGCAVDDAVRARAVEAGLDTDAVEARIASALNDGDAEKFGSWTLLSKAICSISFPEVKTPVPLEDPGVKATISAPGAFEHSGCFIAGDRLLDLMSDRNDQDKDRAQDAYLQFLASGIVSGEVRFYSEDPLATPPGFQVFDEGCADLPNLAAIQQNHALLARKFGDVIRAVGKSPECNGDVMGVLQREVNGLPGNTNAWMFFEILTIARAAGWFEGQSVADRGKPRPPLCLN